MMRTLIAMLLSLAAMTVGASDLQELDAVGKERAVALAAELRCLVCQNQTIADSNAELAVDLRRQIHTQIVAGKSDTEIVDFMVTRYGDFVLYRPPFKATTVFLWLGPALFVVGGVIALLLSLRNRRARVQGNAPLTEAQRKMAAELLADGTRQESR
jgi:cytochrome c-type biogenesis protein CcmH